MRAVQHELLHDFSSLPKDHKHGPEFYESFYKYFECVVDFSVRAFQTFPAFASQCGVDPDNACLVQSAQEAEPLSVADELAAELLGEANKPAEGEAGDADPQAQIDAELEGMFNEGDEGA